MNREEPLRCISSVLRSAGGVQHVDLIDLGADGDDEDLHAGVRHLANALLQQGLGDVLRPAVGEQHQLPPAARRVSATG
ncbi:hypothetical protein EYF80_039657 [Liparis tanakae]|uniref:Uncharacterized protein n=1 Tax=Liparis tanakae TaxID=230148 RepID=A0A4Z2G9I6_9TELE|nr:hypothetical protein EYF80_039657 [Liparis tanakae]